MANQNFNAPSAAFPRAEVEAALDEWWETEQQDASLPADASSDDIMTPAVEIDSHRAVRALIVLQEVVKFEIPETVIAEGGYDDFAEMRRVLIPALEALFEEKREKQNA
ncbi:hypothetical protein [Sphingomonas panaciterrae]|jgi:hypothetical protein|uniref:hypothetical protein n=1 Tax=Sphingomonas panaciterrae TaxID=1462999 RepID=UPI002FF01C86